MAKPAMVSGCVCVCLYCVEETACEASGVHDCSARAIGISVGSWGSGKTWQQRAPTTSRHGRCCFYPLCWVEFFSFLSLHFALEILWTRFVVRGGGGDVPKVDVKRTDRTDVQFGSNEHSRVRSSLLHFAFTMLLFSHYLFLAEMLRSWKFLRAQHA